MLLYYSLHFQFTCSPIKGRKKSTFYKKISDYDDLEKMKVRKSGSDLGGKVIVNKSQARQPQGFWL